MKNLSIILILSLYLFSTTELIQLLKMPILISHCLEHQKNNSKLTIGQFLFDHYNKHDQDGDADTDQKLPFIKHANSLNITAIYCQVSTQLPQLMSTIFFEKKAFFHDDQDRISTYINHIWQPPKLL
ncbi:hypothetical protein [Sphingobacterium faecium]|uniref:hypothetical protein n=1 Tax=Sphingobacterium faecium TaxID=34087 RepID=UPI0011B24A64|nr:hypothetical protein [Sphingobacterium faecium]